MNTEKRAWEEIKEKIDQAEELRKKMRVLEKENYLAKGDYQFAKSLGFVYDKTYAEEIKNLKKETKFHLIKGILFSFNLWMYKHISIEDMDYVEQLKNFLKSGS